MLGTHNESKLEQEFLDLVRDGDFRGVLATVEDPGKTVTLSQNWNFVRRLAREVVGIGTIELMR